MKQVIIDTVTQVENVGYEAQYLVSLLPEIGLSLLRLTAKILLLSLMPIWYLPVTLFLMPMMEKRAKKSRDAAVKARMDQMFPDKN